MTTHYQALQQRQAFSSRSRLMRAAPFCPEPRTGNLGTVYEVRSDNLFTGKMPALSEQWAKYLPEREKLSPLAAAFGTRSGRVAGTNRMLRK